MFPELFKIGSLTIYSHGVMAIFGIIASGYLMYFWAKKARLDTSVLADNIVLTVLAGIIGARLVYFFLYYDQFGSPVEIFYLWNGGMVSYGGFIFGAGAFYLLNHLQKKNALMWLDILAISFPIGLFLGRIGNLLAGEYAGVETDFVLNIDNVVPVPIYEGALLLVIFILCLVLIKKGASLKTGLWSAMVVGLYGAGRFIIDFWRDESDIFWGISLGQFVSLSIFLAMVIVYVLNWQRRRKNVSTKIR